MSMEQTISECLQCEYEVKYWKLKNELNKFRQPDIETGSCKINQRETVQRNMYIERQKYK